MASPCSRISAWAHAESEDWPAAAAGPGLGAEPRPLAPPGGRAARAWREEPPQSTRRSSASACARASTDRDGLSRAGGPRRVVCPRRSHGPGPGSRHRLTRSPPTASDRLPPRGDVRRPREGGAPGIAFPDFAPRSPSGQGRGRGGEAGDKPAACAGLTLPGGSRGSSGPAPTQDGGFLVPLSARPCPPLLFSFFHCSSFFLLCSRAITWSVNPVKSVASGRAFARGALSLHPAPGRGSGFPTYTRVCSVKPLRKRVPRVLPAVMRKRQPSRPPQGEEGDPKTTPIGKGNALERHPARLGFCRLNRSFSK